MSAFRFHAAKPSHKATGPRQWTSRAKTPTPPTLTKAATLRIIAKEAAEIGAIRFASGNINHAKA